MSTGRISMRSGVPLVLSAAFFPTLVMAVSCPQFPDCFAVADSVVAGDADADGVVTHADAQTAKQAVSAPYVLTCSQAAVLDVNLNGAIDHQDANIILEVANSGGDPSLLPNFKRAWGDINRDGVVDIQDVSALMTLLEQGGKPGDFGVVVDLNVDRAFDARDIVELRQCVQGRIDRMGVIAK